MSGSRLYVTGFAKDTTEADLSIYFQSRRRSGGGDVAFTKIEGDSAVLEFEEEEVLNRVLSQDNHVLKECQLKLSRQPCTLSVPSLGDEQHAASNIEMVHKIKVEGLSPKTTKDAVENYFENARRSGGGDVEDVVVSGETAYITFADSGVAQTVASRTHTLDGVELKVEIIKPEDKESAEEHIFSPNEESVSQVIEVSGLAPSTTEDAILNYFENKRRSGGGEIENVELQPGKALVTFLSAEDAQRVVEKGSHRLDGSDLTVVLMAPAKKVPKDPLKLLVKGLNEKTTKDGLLFYMEAISGGGEVCDVMFGNDNVALVSFAKGSEPDFGKVTAKIEKKKLDEKRITVEQVEICSSVLVTGLPDNVSEDTIVLYFENRKRSGGGDVSDLELNPEQKRAVVHFQDSEVVESVVSREHRINGMQFDVRQNYPFLGKTSDMQVVPRSYEVEYDQVVLTFVENHWSDELSRLLQENNLAIDKVTDEQKIVFRLDKEIQLDESSWERICNDVMVFLTQFETESVFVEVEAVALFEERVRELVSDYKSNELEVNPISPENQVKIVGCREKVANFAQQLKDLVSDIVEEEKFKASLVTDELKDIPFPKLLLVSRSGLVEKLQDELNGLKIDVCLKKQGVFFKGPPEMINKATLQIYQLLAKCKEETVELSALIISVLKTDEAEEFIYESFEKEKLVAAVFFENDKASEFTVIAVNRTHAQNAASILKTLMEERSLHLEEDQVQLLKSDKWRAFSESFRKNKLNKVTFDPPTNTLWFGGCPDYVEDTYNKVIKFLDENTIISEQILLPTGKRRFLFKNLKDKVNAIEKRLEAQSVVIKQTEDEESAVVITGTEAGVEEGFGLLTRTIESIISRNIPIDMPGMRKYFLGGQGDAALKHIENQNQCIIQIQSASLKDKPAMSSAPDTSSSENLVCSYVTPENKKIWLYKGDITKHVVDVVVNAANSSLEHVGGVAKAIVDAGGKEIQDDCRKHMAQEDKLLDGDVFVTDAYKLPCKKIIHAVGPRWNYASGMSNDREKSKKERYLSLAIYNSLEEGKSFTSIAFPAISTGVFGFPRELCAKVMINTMLEYSEKNQDSILKDIHIIDRDDTTIKTFASEMRERFGNEAGFQENATNKKTKASSRRMKKARAVTSAPDSPSDPFTIVTPKNVLITLRVGDIAQQEADALVNSTNSDMNLQSNPCAKALSDVAGPTLQQECTSQAPLSAGGLCVTSNGKLKCKNVFHINVQDEQSLCVLLQKCFQEANKREFKTIAVPAIGTGNLGFARDRVATISVDEAQRFIQNTSSIALQEIRYVVFGKDLPTVQAFETEFKHRNQPTTLADTDTGKRRRSRRSIAGSVTLLNEDEEDREGETTNGVTPRAVTKIGKRLVDSQCELKIGELTIQVQTGDITSEMVDAIATVSNTNLDLAQGGGVGAAIHRAGGAAIMRECQTYGPQKPGSVVSTGAGKLEAKSIFHIVPISDDYSGIKSLVFKCLSMADSNRVSSISFPAVGTGNLGLSPKDSAKAMLSAINKFSQGKITTLKLIRVVVFQSPMLQDFHDAMVEFEKDSQSSGILSSVSGFFKGVLGFSNGETVARSLSVHERVSLDIFAGNENDISIAARSVNDIMSRNTTKKEIEHESIEKLSDKRKREIMKFEETHDVKISIQPRVSRIVVQGLLKDVLDVYGAIFDIVTTRAAEEHARGYAELLSQRVQWLYAEDGKMNAYDPDINKEIEEAFRDKKASVQFTMDQQDFEITFKDNQETHLKSGKVTEVCRKDLTKGGLELPKEWETQPTDKDGNENDVHLVTLDPVKNASEYNRVSTAVLRTAKINIKKIERVQTPELYHSYSVKKQAMDKKNGSNEMELFHGTAGSSVPTINRKGFNRSYCGKNAVVHGKGVYFARDASYSTRSTYSPADPQGNRYLYMAKVLVGQYTTGNSNMITPPPRSVNDPTDTYDSVADTAGSGASIIVVFYDNQCYPEYLITFN